jgi:hypothetical protein
MEPGQVRAANEPNHQNNSAWALSPEYQFLLFYGLLSFET